MCWMMSGRVMALDRPDGDVAPELARPEQRRGSGRPVADAPAARTEPAEPRTREECYEALRAADGGCADDHHAAVDSDHSGWDSVDAANRPPPDQIQVSAERGVHILDGDETGGGHRHGIGSPDKTEFPASWNDKKSMSNVLDVARHPDEPPVLQQWNKRWVCCGTRDGVEVSVIVLQSGEVWTAWPEEGGPGVVRNPKKGTP